MDIPVGLVFVAIVAVVLFSLFRSTQKLSSFSEFFGEMESFRAMGELGEEEMKETLGDENWEENLERAKREAEREGNTEKLEALEKVEEMGPLMDSMAGSVEEGEGFSDQSSDAIPSEPTDGERAPSSKGDASHEGVEGTQPSPDEIPDECPQQYCDAMWSEGGGGILSDDGGRYEVLSNGQVRCEECGMIADLG